MVRFEERRRATSQKVLEIARGYLENDWVKWSLGGLASELIEVSRMAEVPNIVRSRMQPLPRYRNRDVFPFTVMYKNEELMNPMTECSPLQQQSFHELVSESTSNERLLMDVRDPEWRWLREGHAGRTWGWYRKSLDHDSLPCASRPFVGIARTDFAEMALTAVHEFSHVHDLLTRPVCDIAQEEASLETELKAFAVEQRVLRYAARHGEYVYIAEDVEALRQRFNGSFKSDNAFRASDSVRKALIKKDLGHILYDKQNAT